MQNPGLYFKANGLQYRDSLEMIVKYMNIDHWKGEGETILDIGCGPANNTWELLRPYIPKGTKIFGADISEKMIEYASKKYPDLDFFCLDIATEKIPGDLIGAFDHVYSTFCLHWALDQKHALRNVYSLLKPGGDFFTCHLVHHPFNDIIYKVASLPKWKKYIENPRASADFGKKHHGTAKKLEDILKDVGFEVSVCDVIERKFTHPSKEELENMLSAVNPHILKIPQNLTEELLEDTLQELYNNFDIGDNKDYTMNYDIVVICAKKNNSLFQS